MFKIPRRIDDLLPADTVQRMLDAIHSGDIATSVREVMGKVGVKDLRPIEKMQAAWQQTRSWLDSISGDTVRDSVQSTINATGGANALLLASDSNTRIRYRPATNFVGEAKIAFVAWDLTSGVNGGIAAVGTRGGSTAYSALYDYAGIDVLPPAP